MLLFVVHLFVIVSGAGSAEGFFDVAENGDFDSDQRERTLKRLQDQLDMQKEMEMKRKELEALMRNHTMMMNYYAAAGG